MTGARNDKDTVVLVCHDMSAPDDRASAILEQQGYRLLRTCPAQGGSLPEPDENLAGAIVYGGLVSVNTADQRPYLKVELDWSERWLAQGLPYLGICLGGQILAQVLGARVQPHPEGSAEYGFYEVRPTAAGREVFDDSLHLYQAHYEGFELPDGAQLLASSAAYPHQAFRYAGNTYGFQFHPEVTPEIMGRWLDDDQGMLARPGTHDRARQLRDSARYDRPMASWLARFLESWLKQPRTAASRPSSVMVPKFVT